MDARYNSEVDIPSSNPDPVTGHTAIRNEGYGLINGSIGLQSNDGKIRGEVFVENLTNTFYFISGFRGAGANRQL